MKRFIAALLCLLLCGCTRQAPAATLETLPEEAAVSVMAGLYDPNHPIEKAYPGLVRAYPMTLRKVHGIRAAGKDVLVLSGQGSTTLTLFSGERLQETASLTVDFSLRQEDPSLRIHENGISFFDPIQRKTLLLDQHLQEMRSIAAPDGLSGAPILSSDGKILYYCTGWSVVAWDLSSGIRRTLKEFSCESQELTALHLNDRILECTVQDNGTASKVFLSSDQGLELGTLPEDSKISTGTDRYFTQLTSGYQKLLIFGSAETAPELLLPEQTGEQQFYLPEDHAAITVCTGETEIQLNYYELSTGILRASLTLDALQTPKSIVNSKGHAVYILTYDPEADCDLLYRWDVLRQPPDPANAASCKAAYHTAEDPDTDALEACRAYAESIGGKYGITVRVWEDAVTVQPWDYQFQPETLAPILQKELKLLEQRLDQYPEGVLQQTKAHFTGLNICLVRQITGAGDGRSLKSATGIQFFHNKEAYVVITTGKYSEQALYHELYHVMETHILTESTALDPWETLNPAGFVYGTSQQNTDIYLQGQTRAFVDRYSMSALKEDRARVLENAMLAGKQDLFRSEYLQRKLRALCTGIREAYGLKQYSEMLPWEQYLINSLAPTQ